MSDQHSSEEMTALILAGGKGARLRSVVSDRSKVMAEVSGRPFITFLIDQLAAADFRKTVISTGYMAETVADGLGDAYRSVELQYSLEHQPLDTGGALRYSLPLLDGDYVLVMNGDSYVDIDLKAYLKWFFDRKREASLLLVEVPDTRRFGSVTVDSDERLISFSEKRKTSGKGWINGGIYIIKTSLVESIPPSVPCSLEREFFPGLLGGNIFGYTYAGAFLDIGTPESFAEADRFMKTRPIL